MNNIKISEVENIRAKWSDEDGCCYFVVQDVVGFFAASIDPAKYWFDMKRRTFENQGIELSANCRKFKFKAPNGKAYSYECANNETIFRIIQSIPSPKAEPFKYLLTGLFNKYSKKKVFPSRAITKTRDSITGKRRLARNGQRIMVTGVSNRRPKHSRLNTTHIGGYRTPRNRSIPAPPDQTWEIFSKLKTLNKLDDMRKPFTPIELIYTIFREAKITNLKARNGIIGKARVSSGKKINNTMEPAKSISTSLDRYIRGLMAVPPEKKINTTDHMKRKS